MFDPSSLVYHNRTWWHRGKPYTRLELILDGAVHAVGLLVAAAVGVQLLMVSRPANVGLAIYFGSLIGVLAISLAFNLAPVTPLKRFLARLDQAAIFLLIAGTYTPLLGALSGSPLGPMMLAVVWGASLIGMALKLVAPERFGRAAVVLYLGIGWSGIVVFHSLAQVLPASSLWLLLAGGTAYSSGIVFHLWERLRFHNVLWHCFVVLGSSLHLWAVLDGVVAHTV